MDSLPWGELQLSVYRKLASFVTLMSSAVIELSVTVALVIVISVIIVIVSLDFIIVHRQGTYGDNDHDPLVCVEERSLPQGWRLSNGVCQRSQTGLRSSL